MPAKDERDFLKFLSKVFEYKNFLLAIFISFFLFFFFKDSNNKKILNAGEVKETFPSCTLNLDLYLGSSEYSNDISIYSNLLQALNGGKYNSVNTISSVSTINNKALYVIANVSKIDKVFSSCGFSDDLTICDNERLGNNCIPQDACSDSFLSNYTYETKVQPVYYITDSDYNNLNEEEKLNYQRLSVAKKKCYPNNHICRKYKDNSKRLYKVDANLIDNSIKNSFILYYKNAKILLENAEIKDGEIYNCLLKRYSCDYKIKDESVEIGTVNLINENSSENKDFINIIQSDLESKYLLYNKMGTCKLGSNKCLNDSNENILPLNYYFKYKYSVKDNEDNHLYYAIDYYVKNVGQNVCKNYLTNCKEILPNNRKSLYESLNKIDPNLSNLSNEGVSSSKNCLIDNDVEDVSYCSDLDKNGNLKYLDGVNGNKKCFLKSCIDLTQEELSKISGGKGKYCSEYRWLRTDSGLKYFPKDEPIYCSDLDGKGKLKFEDGINKNKDNCYLKRCISLTKEEKHAIGKANMENFMDKISLLELEQIEDFDKNILPKYCENSIFYTAKDTVENGVLAKNNSFQELNINVIPCSDFTNGYVANSGNFLNFWFGTYNEASENFTNYETNENNYTCRGPITPIKKTSNQKSFLCGVVSTIDETRGVPISEEKYFSKLCINYFDFLYNDNNVNLNNVCKKVDNILLYLNSDISVNEEIDEEATKNNDLNYLFDENLNSFFSNIYNKFSENCLKIKFATENNCKDNNFDNCGDIVSNFPSYTNEMCGKTYSKCLQDAFAKEKCKDGKFENCFNGSAEKVQEKQAEFQNFNTTECDGLMEIQDSYIEKYKSKFFDGMCGRFNSIIKNDEHNYYDCSVISRFRDVFRSGTELSIALKTAENDCNINFNPDYRPNYIESGNDAKKYLPYPVDGNNNASDKRTLQTSDGICNIGSKDVGCFAPEKDSYYIDTFINSEEFVTLDSPDLPKNRNSKIRICTRFNSMENGNNLLCGERSGSIVKDNCIEIDYEGSGIVESNIIDLKNENLINKYERLSDYKYSVKKNGRNLCVYLTKSSKYCSGETFDDTNKTDNNEKVSQALINSYCASRYKSEAFKVMCEKRYQDIDKQLAIHYGSGVGSVAAGAALMAIGVVIPIFWIPGVALTAAGTVYVTGTQVMGHPNGIYYQKTNPNIDSADCIFEDKVGFDYFDRNVKATIFNYIASGNNSGILTGFNTFNNNNINLYYLRNDNFYKTIENKITFRNNNLSLNELNSSLAFSGGNVIKECGLEDLVYLDEETNTIIANPYVIKDGAIVEEKSVQCLQNNNVYFIDLNHYNSYPSFIFSKGGFNYNNYFSVSKASKAPDTVFGNCSVILNEKNLEDRILIDSVDYIMNVPRNDGDINCKLDLYGNPIGDIEYCRGFYSADGKFYKESQCLRLPLETAPQPYFNLANPDNTPDLFSAFIYLVNYYEYTANNKPLYYSYQDIVLDFLNPKLKFNFDFNSKDPKYSNRFTNENASILTIIDENSTSSNVGKFRYQKKYTNDGTILETYNLLARKTYSTNIDGVDIPKVCTDKVVGVVEGVFDDVNCLAKEDGKCWILLDGDVYCFDRKFPRFNDIYIKIDDNFRFNYPRINVVVNPPIYYDQNTIPKLADINTMFNNEALILKDSSVGSDNLVTSDSNSVLNYGFSETQQFGVSFENSYCSQRVVEYYQYLDEILREKRKDITLQDQNKIGKLESKISIIESNVVPDCKLQDGYSGSIITKKEVDENKYILKTSPIKKQYGAYGAFNEICISDSYFNYMVKSNKKYYNENLKQVLSYKVENNTGKCVLDSVSRNNPKCLNADKVYVYCDANDSDCNSVIDFETGREVYAKTIDCREFLDGIKNYSTEYLLGNSDFIEKMKICYKGGFNYHHTILKNENNNIVEENSCACETYDNDLYYILSDSGKDNLSKYFESRDITKRELGLCVDMKEYRTCNKVKYFGYDGKYVNVRENLYETTTNGILSKGYPYIQHLWRTNERIYGSMNAVQETKERKAEKLKLGNAEFDTSFYCEPETNITDKKELEKYYNDNCLGGTNTIKGACNGFWKQSNNEDIPTARCVQETSLDGETIYQYELIANPCVRYSCPDVFIDDNETILSDELAAVEDFKHSEIKSYNEIEKTDFRSTINNEEKDEETIDKRGNNHGFAVWKSVESQDVVVKAKSEMCLTGFGPAGSNYFRDKYFKNNNYNFVSEGGLYGSVIDYNNYTASQQNQVNYFYNNILINNDFVNTLNNNLPVRYCNQLGEWLTVRDFYSNTNIKNPYYFSNSELWDNVIVGEGDADQGYFDFGDYKFKFTDNVNAEFSNYDKKLYCERLYCPNISIKEEDGLDYNVYFTELKSTDGSYDGITADINVVNKNTPWRHTGGASWEATSASRNSSDNLSVNRNAKSSQKAEYIFENGINDSKSTTDKYVKKVGGICYRNFGYFERGSKFKSGSFDSLYGTVISGQIGDKIDPRQFDLLDNSSETISPVRTCNSVGLWSGVVNSCFRACEMHDMTRTVFSDDIASIISGTRNGEGVYLSPSDILFIRTKANREITRQNMSDEGNLQEVCFDQNNNVIACNGGKGEVYKYGDYITGGATWPRSIANIDSNLETSGEKVGLRYVEVRGSCDSSNNKISSEEIYTYSTNMNGKLPVRKCYEDGTWGPVEGDSRCILQDTCVSLYLKTNWLAELLVKYKEGGNIKKNLSELLNDFAYLRDENVNINNAIGKIEVSNYQNNKKNPSYTNFQVLDDGYEEILTKGFLCNQTGMYEENLARWNFKDEKIGDYIVPKTCTMTGNKSYGLLQRLTAGVVDGDTNNNKITLTSSGLKTITNSNRMYVKNSSLNEVFNEINKPYSKLYFIGTNIENETKKNIEIGEASYKSYQGYSYCDSRYFYNDNSTTNLNDNYIAKKVVYQCEIVNNEPTIGYFTEATNNWKNNLIEAKDCKIKTCGGKNNYQNNFSESALSGIANSSKYELNKGVDYANSHSTLSCPDNYAFVLPYNEISKFKDSRTIDGTKVLEFYTDNGGTNYENYGFVKAINVDCLSNEGYNINGTSANKNSYAYAKFGILDKNQIPTTYCSTLSNSGDSCGAKDEKYIVNNAEFLSKYCVYMGCKNANFELKKPDGTAVENGKTNINFKTEFNLGDYSPFGTLLNIQNMQGDYNYEEPKECCMVRGGTCEECYPVINYNNYSSSVFRQLNCKIFVARNYYEKNFRERCETDFVAKMKTLQNKSFNICNEPYDQYTYGYQNPLEFNEYYSNVDDKYSICKDYLVNQEEKTAMYIWMENFNSYLKDFSYTQNIEENTEIDNVIKSYIILKMQNDSNLKENVILEKNEIIVSRVITEIQNRTDVDILYTSDLQSCSQVEASLYSNFGEEYNCSIDDGSDISLVALKNTIKATEVNCSKTITCDAVMEGGEVGCDENIPDACEAYYITVADLSNILSGASNDIWSEYLESKNNIQGVKDYLSETENISCNIGGIEKTNADCSYDKLKKYITSLRKVNKFLGINLGNYERLFNTDYYVRNSEIENKNIGLSYYDGYLRICYSDFANPSQYPYTYDDVCIKIAVGANDFNTQQCYLIRNTIQSSETGITSAELPCANLDNDSMAKLDEVKNISNIFYNNMFENYEKITRREYINGICDEYINKYNQYLVEAGDTSVPLYDSGLYTIAECKVDSGWTLITDTSCRRRCNGTTSHTIEPSRSGNKGVATFEFDISGLRYNEEINNFNFYSTSGYCSSGLSGKQMKQGTLIAKCGDDGQMSTLMAYDKEFGRYFGSGLAWEIRCGGDIECMGSTKEYKYYGLNYGEKAFVCLPDNVSSSISGDSVISTGFSKFPTLTIKTKAQRRGAGYFVNKDIVKDEIYFELDKWR